MKSYELTVILDGKATPAKAKAYQERLEKQLKLLSGKIVTFKNWGKKEFSYPINKLTSGTYLFFELELGGRQAKELAVKLRSDEDVVRHLLVLKK